MTCHATACQRREKIGFVAAVFGPYSFWLLECEKGQVLIKRTEIKTIKLRPLLLVDSTDPFITPVRASKDGERPEMIDGAEGIGILGNCR
jgi:hypothetical protein